MEDVKKFQSRIDADAWITFKKQHPENAARIELDPKSYGFKKVIRRTAEGDVVCYIPEASLEERLVKMQEKIKSAQSSEDANGDYNQYELSDIEIKLEEHVNRRKLEGTNLSDEELVKEFVALNNAVLGGE